MLHHIRIMWEGSPVDVFIRKQIGYFLFLFQGKIPKEAAGLGSGQSAENDHMEPRIGKVTKSF